MEESPLIGEPTFLAIGEGRLRCVETGHELREADKASYAKSKSCCAALFDLVLSQGRFPLSFFEQSTTNKNQIICKLTGAVVNKNEAAVWKHVTGKKFARRLDNKKDEQKDGNVMRSDDGKTVQGNEPEEHKFKRKQKKEKENKKNKKKNLEKECNGAMDVDDEEAHFWMPPENTQQDAPADKDEAMVLDADEHGEDELRVKRSAMAVGPSSFASRKKKRKTKS